VYHKGSDTEGSLRSTITSLTKYKNQKQPLNRIQSPTEESKMFQGWGRVRKKTYTYFLQSEIW